MESGRASSTSTTGQPVPSRALLCLRNPQLNAGPAQQRCWQTKFGGGLSGEYVSKREMCVHVILFTSMGTYFADVSAQMCVSCKHVP